MNAISVTHLTVTLPDKQAVVVDHATFTVQPGQVMGVVGESGCGKSTMALALLGYARPGAKITGGRVVVDGVDLLALAPQALQEARRSAIAFVPQDPASALNPLMSVGVQIRERIGDSTDKPDELIRDVLTDVGLPATPDFLRRRPRALSGGQQQRIAIAMAVISHPKVIVLDEPTTGLDVSTQAMVLEMVSKLCRSRDMAAIYISHDLGVVASVADTVAVMYAGRIVESGAARAVLRSPSHPYTRALLDAIPSVTEKRRLIPITGHAPDPAAERTGCGFAPRCALATPECLTTDPAPTESPAGGTVRCLHPGATAPGDRSVRVVDPSHAVEALHTGTVLSVRDLSAHHGDTQVLFDVSFGLDRGDCLAIVGESGSGKTTLSRCLIGLHEQQSGTIALDGRPVPAVAARRTAEDRRRVQYIFQNPYRSLNPRRTIADSLRVPLEHFFGLGGQAARVRIDEALDRVELPARVARLYPGEVSGGQQQRVAIARALLSDPELLICDEITSALDVSVQAHIVELLRSLLAGGLSMVFVTHNLAVVRSIADDVVVLSRGRAVERGATEDIFRAPSQDYTRQLLADTREVVGAG